MTPELCALGRMTWIFKHVHNCPPTPSEQRYITRHYPGGMFGYERDAMTLARGVVKRGLEEAASFFLEYDHCNGNAKAGVYVVTDHGPKLVVRLPPKED